MAYSKISYARNRLIEARAAIGEIRLYPEAYGSARLIPLVIELHAGLGEAIAILEAPPPKPRSGARGAA